MAATVFHESFGDVTRYQLAAYRRYNVSPSDHDTLVEVLGGDPKVIVAAVKKYSGAAGFLVWPFLRDHQ